jgi:hypothetical protein
MVEERRPHSHSLITQTQGSKMKQTLLFGAMTAVLTLSLSAAGSSPKDDLTSAAKALGEKANYSWRTTTVVPEDSPFRPGPWDGKIEKDGLTHVTLSFGDNTSQFVVKGEKGAATTQEGGWQSLSEMESGEGMARFFGMMIRNFKAPAAQAAQLASYAKELKKDGELYTSDLTEEGAKVLLTWRPRSGGEGPKVAGAQGSVKFWLKDGALTKYEFKLKGKVTFNDNEFDNDRTTTVEIKDVGTTKLNVPEEAKKKLS